VPGVPAGFGATKEEYVDWFVGEVEGSSPTTDPVDLVGHDWGGGIGMRASRSGPSCSAAGCAMCSGLFHPDYVWHDFAQIWQTPGAGEEYFEQSAATPVADRAALLGRSASRPPDRRATGRGRRRRDEPVRARAVPLGGAAGDGGVGAELGPAASVPGLAIIAPLDPFVQGEDPRRAVEQLGCPPPRDGRAGALVDAGRPGRWRGRARDLLGVALMGLLDSPMETARVHLPALYGAVTETFYGPCTTCRTSCDEVPGLGREVEVAPSTCRR
jgi:pimeloyl-ACP methyl ester carboxylesterase